MFNVPQEKETVNWKGCISYSLKCKAINDAKKCQKVTYKTYKDTSPKRRHTKCKKFLVSVPGVQPSCL